MISFVNNNKLGVLSWIGAAVSGGLSLHYEHLSKSAATGAALYQKFLDSIPFIKNGVIELVGTEGLNEYLKVRDRMNIANENLPIAHQYSKVWQEDSEFYAKAFLVFGTVSAAFFMYKCLKARNQAAQ